MKQRITLKQWQELTLKKQREFQLTLNRGGFPTIGDLIEFLYKTDTVVIESEERESPIQGWELKRKYHSKELVDGLWEWVKDILNQKT